MSTLAEVEQAYENYCRDVYSTKYSGEYHSKPDKSAVTLRGYHGQEVDPIENIVCTGVGLRRKDGKCLEGDNTYCIKVFVQNKNKELGSRTPEITGKTYHGVDIDVEEFVVPEFQAKKTSARSRTPQATRDADHRKRHKPIPGGVMIMPDGSGYYGTLGGFVKKPYTDFFLYAMTNNHVVEVNGHISLDNDLIQPSRQVSGFNAFARISDYVVVDPTRTNRLDVAIAAVYDHRMVDPGRILGLPHYVPRLIAPKLRMKVQKSGARTGVTSGMITDFIKDGFPVRTERIDWPGVGSVRFTDIMRIEGNGGAFSLRGDSGSFVIEKDSGRPLGLLFAGEEKTGAFTFACDLHRACQELGVVLAGA